MKFLSDLRRASCSIQQILPAPFRSGGCGGRQFSGSLQALRGPQPGIRRQTAGLFQHTSEHHSYLAAGCVSGCGDAASGFVSGCGDALPCIGDRGGEHSPREPLNMPRRGCKFSLDLWKQRRYRRRLVVVNTLAERR